ncbi:MAG: sigma-54-dependent Fis family transcriptional regulator, partial [Deltaproteobacteria bacterium]|nr:sigma-54-dependent Fis family transcriptional regulator [Deltaproteobacteria bacterium]
PIQLAKTRIQLARLELDRKNRAEARNLAQKARIGLSGFWEDKFPDEIRALLDESPDKTAEGHSHSIAGDNLIQLLSDLVPSLDMDEFFTRIVFTMNRYFSAERGGLFWMDDLRSKTLSLHVSRNLTQFEVNSTDFRTNMMLVQKCCRDGKPRLVQPDGGATSKNRPRVRAVLCLPLKSEGKLRGVLYHDNSYLLDCFDFLSQSTLDKLSALLSVHIDRMSLIEKRINEVKESTLAGSAVLEQAGSHQILFQSQIMSDVLNQVDQAARSDTAVLIQGETGVGKELLAQRLHQMSARQKKPFIIIDPTTIPENLVESELFGYEKGAFTGADRQKRGRIELAHQGTLFIDEIGEIPRALQAKLLRVLQEKTLSRIGSHQSLVSDFRLVAATNRNLAEEVNKGNFREDLFYRINIVPINPPPLRDRSEDILLMAHHFLDRFVKKYKRPHFTLTREMEAQLTNYHWSGNVRELINVIERSVILSKDDTLELNLEPEAAGTRSDPFGGSPSLDEVQRRYLLQVLKRTDGRIAGPGGAADILGLKPSTLYHRMKKLGIPR